MEKSVEFLKKYPGEFTLTEIEMHRLIPWAQDGRTIRKIIETDLAGPNLLCAHVTGTATRRRYLVLSRNIIKYLKAYGPAFAHQVPETKNHGRYTGKTRGTKPR